MKNWSPLTKLLLGVAVLAVPYLLWTSGGGDGPAAPAGVSQARRSADAASPADAAGDAGPAEDEGRRRTLPPLQNFAAVVERPLFTPTRRLVRPVDPVAAEPEPPAQAGGEEEPAEAVPQTPRPDLHFFGTLRRGGEVKALVTKQGGAGVDVLGVGDPVDEWEVRTVDRDRLVLAHQDEEAVYAIFAPGSPGSRPPRRAGAGQAAGAGAGGGGDGVDGGSSEGGGADGAEPDPSGEGAGDAAEAPEEPSGDGGGDDGGGDSGGDSGGDDD